MLKINRLDFKGQIVLNSLGKVDNKVKATKSALSLEKPQKL